MRPLLADTVEKLRNSVAINLPDKFFKSGAHSVAAFSAYERRLSEFSPPKQSPLVSSVVREA